MLYKGTSPSLWLLEAFVVIGLVALAIWVVIKVLVVLAVLAAVAAACFLLWLGWLEARDRVLARRSRPAG